MSTVFNCCTNPQITSGCSSYPASSIACLDSITNYIQKTPNDIIWEDVYDTNIRFWIQNTTTTNLKLFIEKVFEIKTIELLKPTEYKKLIYIINLIPASTWTSSPPPYTQKLKDWCSSENRETIENLLKFSKNTGLDFGNDKAALCGCHLPDSNYTHGNILGDNKVWCDPICLIPNAVKEKQCSQNVCILDDINIKVGLDVGYDISFDTLCGKTCQKGNCKCMFSSINVTRNDIDSLDGIDFTTNCGNDCWILDNDGNQTGLTDCSQVKDALEKQAGITPGGPSPFTITNLIYILITFIVIIIIFGIVLTV